MNNKSWFSPKFVTAAPSNIIGNPESELIKLNVSAWLYVGSPDHPRHQSLWTGDQIWSHQVCKTRDLLQGVYLQGKCRTSPRVLRVFRVVLTLGHAWSKHLSAPRGVRRLHWPSSVHEVNPNWLFNVWYNCIIFILKGAGWSSSPPSWVTAGPPP